MKWRNLSVLLQYAISLGIKTVGELDFLFKVHRVGTNNEKLILLKKLYNNAYVRKFI